MLFAPHIDITTSADEKKRQSGKQNKSDHNFPHIDYFQKKTSVT